MTAAPPPSRAPHDPSAAPAADTDLGTERLLLRPWSDGDLAAVLDGTRQPHWAPDFPAEGDRVIAGFTARTLAARGVHGQRQILERDGGLVVGAIGLFWPPAEGSVAFGYGIVPSRRGRGYASEAARALVAFALTAPGVHTVCADIERGNPASGRVLEKAGLERWRSDETHVYFRLTAPTGA
ncbi:GNAT family N-acetyltransferase [Streptomyces kronopolitis]|uniref:GNAT family N-acetyltransferase n=1 Tax=Streptomyces kronopolitis TaxID=1612435 RepID=UPI003420B76E